ncbi:MAG: DUF4019 domain-containing protein [Ramlibacter sp.]
MNRSALFAAALCAVLLTPAAHAQAKTHKAAAGKPARAASAATPAASAASAAGTETTDPEIVAKEEAGVLAAQGWLLLLDRRDWGTAWETAASVFRGAVPLGRWMDGIPKVRGDLGALVERTPSNSNYRTQLEGRPPGEYVSVVFVSKFEQREVEEVVTTVLEPDGKWRVTGYSTR